MFAFYNNYTDIINQVDQLKIWSYICGHSVQLNQPIYSPFRPDNNPKCYLYERYGNILIADWGNKQFHGIGIVKALELKDNLTYKEVIRKLNNSKFSLPSSFISKPNTTKKEKKFIFKLEFKYRPFNSNDHLYWLEYGITLAQLKKEDIHAVSYFFKNSRIKPTVTTQHRADKLAYGFSINNRRKLYQPFSKKYKWLTNFNQYDIGGKADRSSKTLILTKSIKDYLVIKYNCDYNVQFIPSETVDLNCFYLDIIREEYDRIIVWMDNDPTGHAAAVRIAEQIGNKAEAFWLSSCNDPADYIKLHKKIDIDAFINRKTTNTISYTPELVSHNRKILYR